MLRKLLLVVAVPLLITACGSAQVTERVVTATPEPTTATPVPTDTPEPTEEPLPECWGLYGQIIELVEGHPEADHDIYARIQLTTGEVVQTIPLTSGAWLRDFVNLREQGISYRIVEVCEP